MIRHRFIVNFFELGNIFGRKSVKIRKILLNIRFLIPFFNKTVKISTYGFCSQVNSRGLYRKILFDKLNRDRKILDGNCQIQPNWTEKLPKHRFSITVLLMMKKSFWKRKMFWITRSVAGPTCILI